MSTFHSPLLPRSGDVQMELSWDIVGPVVDHTYALQVADEAPVFSDGIDAGFRSYRDRGDSLCTAERFNDHIISLGYGAAEGRPFTIGALVELQQDPEWGEFATHSLASALDRLSGARRVRELALASPWQYVPPAEREAAETANADALLAEYETYYEPVGEPVSRDDGTVVRLYDDKGTLRTFISGLTVLYTHEELMQIGRDDRARGVERVRQAYLRAGSSQIRRGAEKLMGEL